MEFMEFHEKCGIHDLYGKRGFHVKITRKQPFVQEAENDSKTYKFLRGREAVRLLLGPEL